MDTTVEDILQNVTIPEDDGKLQQALAELDSKLAAWSGAIQHAQSSLKEVALTKETRPAQEPAESKVQTVPQAPAEPKAQTVPQPPVIEKIEKTVKSQEPSPPPGRTGHPAGILCGGRGFAGHA